MIAAFVIFAGTNSWGETLTKGWQRLLGTLLGVPAGVLVATLLTGHEIGALAGIFVCLFCAFYFMTVTYSLMTFWITTMLALLYGLLGQFSFGVLMLRIEETAIGAVIGATVAVVVLPTNTRTAIRADTRAFLTSLSALIEVCAATMCGEGGASPSEQARQVDRDLQQFRVTAKPLLAGVAGLAGRRSIRRALGIFSACDQYGRSLARSSEQYRDPVGSPPPASKLAQAFSAAAAQTRRNIEALQEAIEGVTHRPWSRRPTTSTPRKPWRDNRTATATAPSRGPRPGDSSPRCTPFARSSGPSSPPPPTSVDANACGRPSPRHAEALCYRSRAPAATIVLTAAVRSHSRGEIPWPHRTFRRALISPIPTSTRTGYRCGSSPNCAPPNRSGGTSRRRIRAGSAMAATGR